MESSHLTLEKYKSKLQYALNSKGFMQITFEVSYLSDITKSEIDQQAKMFKQAEKSIQKEGYKLQPHEVKK